MIYRLANISVIGCFCVLTAYSYGMVFGHLHKPAREVLLWRVDKAAVFHARQAAVLASLYGITSENINNDIFGGDK